MGDEDDNEFELLHINRVFVFRIPASTTGGGHRAKSWSSEHIWAGQLTLVQVGDVGSLKLEHDPKDSGKQGLFAACTLSKSETGLQSVEPVIDSSRYFVLRIEDGTGKHAFIGLGFNDRTDAFKFKASFRDYQKQFEAREVVTSSDPIDFKLNSPIRIGGIGKTTASKPKTSSKPSDDSLFSISGPPKSAAGQRRTKAVSTDDDGDDDLFGDIAPRATSNTGKESEVWDAFDF